MNRIWNLQAKIVALIVLLLLGSFLLQSVVDHYSKEHLLAKLSHVAEDLTDEVSRKLMNAVAPSRTGEVAVKSVNLVIKNASGRRNKLRAHVLLIDTVELQRHFRRILDRRFEELRRNFDPVRLESNSNELLRTFLPARDREEQLTLASLLDQIPSSTPAPVYPIYTTSPRSSERAFDRIYRETSRTEEAASIDLSPYTSRMEDIFGAYRSFDMLSNLGILLLGISLAWFIGVRVTRPMTELSEGFQRVAAGDLEHRVQVEKSGEFALLGEQFNRMAEGLEHNRELERELVLRERVQHMGDLAAGVAHDVRNPLNAIHLNIGQIRDEFLPEDAVGQARFLRFTSDVQREVERLNNLVTNYLSLAQPSSTDVEPVAPNDLLRELARLLEKEAAGRHVELRVDLEDRLPELMWNRQEVKSAFLNVAINALQAMEPDGGSLDVISGLRVEGGVEEVSITFIDTGCGILEENLEKVFIPYFTTRKGGTGLGMAVARRIVERNGGRLQVTSRVGEGTAMSFLFPLGEQEEGT